MAQLPPSASVGVGQLPSGASASAKTNPEVGVEKLPREASKIAIENLMHISEDIRTEQLQTTAVFGNSDDDFGLQTTQVTHTSTSQIGSTTESAACRTSTAPSS